MKRITVVLAILISACGASEARRRDEAKALADQLRVYQPTVEVVAGGPDGRDLEIHSDGCPYIRTRIDIGIYKRLQRAGFRMMTCGPGYGSWAEPL